MPVDVTRSRGQRARVGHERHVARERVERRQDDAHGHEKCHRQEDDPVDELSPSLGLCAGGDVLVGKDDAPEEIRHEVALRLGLRLRVLRMGRDHRRAHVEGGHHPADDAVDRPSLLRPAREVDAAQHGCLPEVVRLEECPHEVDQSGLERRHLEGKLVDARAELRLSLGADTAYRARVEAFDEQIELRLQRPRRIAPLGPRQREGDAPDLPALALPEVAPGLDEAGDEVDLREHHVDGDQHLQARRYLVDARAESLRDAVDLVLARLHEIRDADRDEDSVDGFARTVPLERVEEGDPLVVVVRLGRVAAGGVEEDRLVREPPVAVARAPDAAHPAAAAGVDERKGQARLAQRGRLPRTRGADDHVPGEAIERAAAAADAALTEGLQPLLHLRLESHDLRAAIGSSVERLLLRLFEEVALQGARLEERADAAADEPADDEQDGEDGDEDLEPERPPEQGAADRIHRR